MAVSPPSPLDRENSCTFLRLFFALLVVWGHSCVLGGFGEEPLTILTGGALSGREMAVQGFFVLSGFLIAKSLGENPSLWRFACHRAFRVLPAFWVYLFLMVFVLAPALIEIRWPDRFSYLQLLTLGPASAWHYFTHNWAVQALEFRIAPLFSANPEPFQVNGSLWSVRYEATFYLCAAAAAAAWQMNRRTAGLAAVLALLGMLATGWVAIGFAALALLWRVIVPRGWGLAAAFVALYGAECVMTFRPDLFARVPRELALSRFLLHPLWRISALAFLGGMLAWRYRALLRWDARVFALTLGLLVAGACFHQWRFAMPVALPYVVLYLAARLPFQKVERWGDYSYGIYIFSFPIQQLLYFWGLHRFGFAAYLGGSLVLSLAAGVLSWWLVEKPALRLGRHLGAWSLFGAASVRSSRPVPTVAVQLSLPIEGQA